MAVEAAREIQCYECKASLPRNEDRYLVIWQRGREYFSAVFGRNCCLRVARRKYHPPGKYRPITIFSQRRAADAFAEKLNARRNRRPVLRANTWSDLDR